MRLSKHAHFWLLIFAVLALFFWCFYQVLWSFLIGWVIAYLLNPLVNKCQSYGASRLLAANMAMFGFLIVLVLFLLLFVPIIVQQMTDLRENIPFYAEKVIIYTQTHFSHEWQQISPKILTYVQEYFGSALSNAAGITKYIFKHLLSSSLSILQAVTSFIIIFIVAFYLLLDWNLMTQKIDSWIPRHYLKTVRDLMQKIDSMQAAFIRGQLLVCLCMTVYYISAFIFLGVHYSFILGLTTGILTFIPYLGASIGFIMTLGVALAQYLPEYTPLLMIAGTFAIGQTLEGYVLVPKMVGGSVNMHPVWIMFALMAFGSVFGIAGMLIAVPVTAALGVIVNFMLEHYILSCYYDKDTKS